MSQLSMQSDDLPSQLLPHPHSSLLEAALVVSKITYIESHRQYL